MGTDAKIRPFLDEQGRLIALPAKHTKRMAALGYLVEKLEKDRIYKEKEVNELLNAWSCFGDPATLRRELYNAFLIDRAADGSAYWRRMEADGEERGESASLRPEQEGEA